MFIHEWIPPSSLGPIHVYGLCVAFGVTIAYCLTLFFIRKNSDADRAIMESLFDHVAIGALISGVVGARLLFVAYHWNYFKDNFREIPLVWHGGWVWHGGLIAALCILFIYFRKKRELFWRLADVSVPGLAIGQAIGRWGNYFNQEAYGIPTALPWGVPIDEAYRVFGFESFQYFHPMFLYESFFLLILGIVFSVLLLKKKMLRAGTLFLWYVVATAAGRLVLEFLRIDEVPILFGFRAPQWIALGMVLLASLLLFRQYKRV